MHNTGNWIYNMYKVIYGDVMLALKIVLHILIEAARLDTGTKLRI